MHMNPSQNIALTSIYICIIPRYVHLVLNLFSFPEGLHCLFQLILTLFQVIKEHHIKGREVIPR